MYTEILKRHIRDWKRNRGVAISILLFILAMLCNNICRTIHYPDDKFAPFGVCIMISSTILMIWSWWFSNKQLKKSIKRYEEYIESKDCGNKSSTSEQ